MAWNNRYLDIVFSLLTKQINIANDTQMVDNFVGYILHQLLCILQVANITIIIDTDI